MTDNNSDSIGARRCFHLMHLPSSKCLGCGEQHQPLNDYQPGDDETYIREHLSEDAQTKSEGSQ